MRIIALADIHGHMNALAAFAPLLRSADLVLLLGDLTHFGRSRDAEPLIEAIARHNTSIMAIIGNCDYPDVNRVLDERGINLHGCSRTMGAVTFVGLGGSAPCPRPTPNVMSPLRRQQLLEQVLAQVDQSASLVLVSHEPPYGTNADLAYSNRHVGSRVVRKFVEQHQPDLCLCGHIHESRCVDRLGATTIVNPGPARDGYYAWVDLGTDGRLAGCGLGRMKASLI